MASQLERREMFEHLAEPGQTPKFFAHVADDVRWTVMGTHPLAGTYTSKDEFLERMCERFEPLMTERVQRELRHLHLAGDVVVAELRTTSTAIDGSAYDNTFCWVCRFDGDWIVEVRAYLDSALVADTLAHRAG